MTTKNKPMTRTSRRLLIVALAMGVGVGGVGSVVLSMVQNNQAWLVIMLVILAMIEGYIIGRINNTSKKG